MRIENFPKLKRSNHSPKRDEFIDVSSDPSYFSLDGPFKFWCRLSHVTCNECVTFILKKYRDNII